MEKNTDARLLRVFVGESDKINHVPLYEVIVREARAAGLAGATAWRGLLAYGPTSRIKTTKLLDLSSDMPIIIEIADTEMLFSLFNAYEAESARILEKGFVLPAYDYVLKCSHTFNLLDARNAISVTERTGYIARVRALASRCCEAFAKQREDMGHPLMKKFC